LWGWELIGGSVLGRYEKLLYNRRLQKTGYQGGTRVQKKIGRPHGRKRQLKCRVRGDKETKGEPRRKKRGKTNGFANEAKMVQQV